ncbi:uncharacterized protein TRIADDRAFT_59769 [Trichoplax adhaerens]|uniref:Uncharacterized protein n=1 Tax=Trichoplax adhaerens TaxID=10228 RepID=B3S6D7_TRIAD|nr:predicted protein [Trichoplax adhaerens]EDV21603.1 predicted protein [Trichoplax adhaerens]|eukprot:XP_002115751.1 predicted protein [Trichoplax adhaerens]
MEPTSVKEDNLTWDKLNAALAKGENVAEIFNLKVQGDADRRCNQKARNTTENVQDNIELLNVQHNSAIDSSFSFVYCREDCEAVFSNVTENDIKLLPSRPFVLLDDIATIRSAITY